MTDEHIKESHFLVTYEWRSLGRHSSPDFRRDNEVIKGCPGIWWAEKLAWYRDYEEKGREKMAAYRARGEEVPLSEIVESTELRFVGAVPITEDGFDALDGVVG